MTAHKRDLLMLNRMVFLAALILAASGAMAQIGPSGPPAVGVMPAERKPITESTEINGRIQAINRVDIVARVTAFLDEQLFEEGAQVKKGDLLYRLERAPFVADLEAKKAAVAQAEAQLENANIQFRRAEALMKSPAFSQVTYDDARATQRSAAAQLQSAQAAQQTSQINLDYTEIRSPIDGRIGRTAVTVGNVVSPTSGVLTTIVSQDPMYVVFPIPVRRALELRDRYASKGGFDAFRIRVRLPDDRLYGQTGKLDFADNTISQDTDTIVLRGTIPNPILPREAGGNGRIRELTDNMFVTVLLEAVEPRQVLAVPRAAILSDQLGDYVYVVDKDNVARQRRVKLGQSTPELASVIDGLKEGENVVVEGIQRVRPNLPVAPGPAAAVPSRS